MRIEFQSTFNDHLKKGINLFLGAGFSIYAKDKNGDSLPLGAKLALELSEKFECPHLADLTKVCTIIDSSDSVGLKDYLADRFRVVSFDSAYYSILKINAPRIFTTNIDDLPYRIFEKTTYKYLNNVFVHGNCFNDSTCIDFIPIHGSLDMPDVKFLFNKQEVSGSYRSQLNAWMSLTHSATQIPSVFLGYSLEDVGSIESLFGPFSQPQNQKDKWILLHEDNEANETYFKALGFKIIVADIKEFLQYIDTVDFEDPEQSFTNSADSIEEIYPNALVPTNLRHSAIRQIDEFFLGSPPIWSDVFSHRIASTSHLDTIADYVVGGKHLVITGIPASGKSTLLLQLANKLNTSHRVLIFSNLTVSKASIIRNEIRSKSIILIDDCSTDIYAFIELAKNPKIRLVGFDRYYNIDIVFHHLPEEDFHVYDVSELTPQDVQKIYDSLPLSIRKEKMVTRKNSEDQISIFEIVSNNVTKSSISERYKKALAEMDDTDPILLDLLIMVCYVHACRVPVSFEMVNAFLSDRKLSYEDVLSTMDALKGLVSDTFEDTISELMDEQDYYQPRSHVLSETVISQVHFQHFRRVFEQFHDLVPQHLIPNFHVFKRSAYDAFYTGKAFTNWRDGLGFYEKAYETDRNPFLLQQCSLFLLRRKRYHEAAIKIDKALQTSRKRIISIENTHAIILFKANIGSSQNPLESKRTLDKSMNILIKCYADDKRKTYHALAFGEQALEYFQKYSDKTAIDYLEKAQKWLKEVKFHPKARFFLGEIQKIL